MAAAQDEFRSFLREVGIRAFDHFAALQSRRRKGAGGVARLSSDWTTLTADEKEAFWDGIISAAQNVLDHGTSQETTDAAVAKLKPPDSSPGAKRSGRKGASRRRGLPKKRPR